MLTDIALHGRGHDGGEKSSALVIAFAFLAPMRKQQAFAAEIVGAQRRAVGVPSSDSVYWPEPRRG
jgi:hypothetical protein